MNIVITDLNEINLTQSEAWALAQFIKRLTWDGIRGCAVDDDEVYVIKDALYKLQKVLVEEGISPR